MKNINNCDIMNKRCLIDLHLHLDGSLSVASVKEIAKMQNIEIPLDNKLVKLLSVSSDCRNLNEYLEKFDFPLSLLQTKESISKAVSNLIKELHSQGIIYAEIRFAPQKHTCKGLSQRAVIEAAIAGLENSFMDAGLILCCMRGKENKKENLETVQLAEEYLHSGVIAVDLAGAEALYPTEDYAEEFRLAKKLHVPFTIHAGEAAGPQSVYYALKLGASRIGHGVRSVEDGDLLMLLSEKGVTLECCPTSNLQTQVFKNLKDYPIKEFLDTGVKFTVNTDNMTVSGTTLKKEWQILIEEFSLSDSVVKKLLLNSAQASFTDENIKNSLKKKIEAEFK